MCKAFANVCGCHGCCDKAGMTIFCWKLKRLTYPWKPPSPFEVSKDLPTCLVAAVQQQFRPAAQHGGCKAGLHNQWQQEVVQHLGCDCWLLAFRCRMQVRPPHKAQEKAERMSCNECRKRTSTPVTRLLTCGHREGHKTCHHLLLHTMEGLRPHVVIRHKPRHLTPGPGSEISLNSFAVEYGSIC